MQINRLKIGLLFNNKDTAIQFIMENAPNAVCKIDSKNELIYETSILRFEWIKPSISFKAKRLNYIFTTKDILNTNFFDTVICPMITTGICIIDE